MNSVSGLRKSGGDRNWLIFQTAPEFGFNDKKVQETF
jgi:hypothetical protein